MIALALKPERWIQRIHVCDVVDLDAVFGNGAECTPLAIEPLSANVRSLKGRSISIVEIRARNSYQLRRHICSGCVAIGFADAAFGFSVRPRNRLDSQAIVVAGEGLLDVRLLGASRAVWIEIDLSAYPHLASFAGQRAEASVFVPSERATRGTVGDYAAAMLSMCTADRLLLEDDSLYDDLEGELVRRVTNSLLWSTAAPAPTKRERKMDELARRVVAYMWRNIEQRFTLPQICRSAGSCTRNAIYCFKDLFGLGPITYLKLLRLSAVHRRMLDPSCTLRIIDVAADLGFWHMGHFGSDYRRVFGRTASETIASVRTTSRRKMKAPLA